MCESASPPAEKSLVANAHRGSVGDENFRLVWNVVPHSLHVLTTVNVEGHVLLMRGGRMDHIQMHVWISCGLRASKGAHSFCSSP